MRASSRLLIAMYCAALCAGALAQDKTPAPETPRPQDLEPAVQTSSAAAKPNTPVQAADKTATSATAAAASPTAPAVEQTKPRRKGQAERLELDTTQITGNRELPKVLYIVPWKRADLGDVMGRPVNSLLDEVLTPVDRDVFKRENRYYRALRPDASHPGSAAPASQTQAAPPPDAIPAANPPTDGK
jgi:hypothetical protein